MTFFKPHILMAALIATAAALPATAQTADCGGVGANGQWVGGSETASDIATASNYQEQMALVLAGNQYVSLFSVSAATEVRVEAAGRGGGDPQIDLYDSTGSIVVSDDDSGGDGAARAEVMLNPGTYCLAMKSFDGAPMTGFVRIGRAEQEALTAGLDTSATDGGDEGGMSGDTPVCTADTITMGLGVGAIDAELAQGVVGNGSVDDSPYWRFTIDSPQAVSILAENVEADPLITLYDSTGTYVADNDDSDGLNSRIDMSTPLAAGTYCIAVQALSNTALPITITVKTYDPAEALQGMYNRAEAAPPMDGSVPITDLGVIATRQRVDAQISDKAKWYKIDVEEGGLLVIEAISSGDSADPYLALFDDLGRSVANNDDYGDGLNALVTAKVTAGSYLLALKDVNSGGNGFVRMLIERYVPAK